MVARVMTVLAGGDGADEIHAGSGDDDVDAGAGNDLIVGGDGAGNDRYYGGSGFDTVRYSSATQAITVNLTTSSAAGLQIGQDSLASIENVIGGSGADQITGSAVANLLIGGVGKDTIDGAAGIDTADYSDKSGAVAVTLARRPMCRRVGWRRRGHDPQHRERCWRQRQRHPDRRRARQRAHGWCRQRCAQRWLGR